VGKLLPDAYDPEVIPQVTELDELQAYVKRKPKIWLWTAVDHFRSGILGWVSGDHSSETFEPLWDKVRVWECYFYVTDGWSVYPMFIPDRYQIMLPTYMTLFRERKYPNEAFRKEDYIARLFVILSARKCSGILLNY
jgi:IS1 family transposase